MKNRFALVAAALLVTLPSAAQVLAHCQVPCGIYGDERRFEEMLEDTQTITKAITQIGELSGTHDANGHNQLARWVVTKEDHASNIQEIIGQYFLAQRIKADSDNYVEQLKAAHAVIVSAMKCKQSADPATAKALEEAIHDLYRAYEGKEPVFGENEAGHTHAVVAATTATHEHSHGEGHEAHTHVAE